MISAPEDGIYGLTGILAEVTKRIRLSGPPNVNADMNGVSNGISSTTAGSL